MKVTLPITQEQILNARPSKDAWPEGVRVVWSEYGDMEIQANRRISGREIDAVLWGMHVALAREKKQELLGRLNQLADTALSKGFISSALGAPHRYDLRMEDQMNLTGLVIAQIDSPFRCQAQSAPFKEHKPHTKEQLKQVFEEGLAYKARVLNFYGAQKAQVESLQELKSLEAFELQELKESDA
ncbi:DUF4376 domain-containing protein [Helicobacter salomonis]|uniref:DUF4376 domain-containing protein n=1 Tax=Helicobacter salomonis TaxID=56878 RepID=UPI000CF052D2|nr:hypothetical protein [Helicobacter salomonis]